jgi:hypothetical protein
MCLKRWYNTKGGEWRETFYQFCSVGFVVCVWQALRIDHSPRLSAKSRNDSKEETRDTEERKDGMSRNGNLSRGKVVVSI